jgi:eukaryotic-like serine/threonine-protein kinase
VTLLAGRYELGQELGAGGMGRVVAAHDQVLGRDVAIKLLSPRAERVTRERFVREARTAAKLHHPNVVAVYDTGEEDEQPYLVMELVRGQSLADVIRTEGRLDVEDAVGITVGVLDGLAVAHRTGMVHRDVKPANVLLPDEGGVKLSDFGIAKLLDEAGAELTATGSLMGTPTYLAPELVGGSPPSPASDVYSVGCLLYAQLTGEPPFTEGDPLAIAYAHRNEPVPPIEEARPDLPPDIVAVVERALAKDPGERYDSATAMRTALLEGPDAVPPSGDTTVALAGAGPAATQVLDGSENEPTRVVGAPAAADGADPGRGRRWWMPLLIALGVLLAVLLLWSLLSGGDLDEPETDLDETQEVEPEPEPEPEPDEPPPAEAPESPAEDPEEDSPPEELPPDDEPAEEEEEEPAEEEEDPTEDLTEELDPTAEDEEATSSEEETASDQDDGSEQQSAEGDDTEGSDVES